MATGTRKVAIVTGASQGIGEALVLGFKQKGYAVVATSRSIQASTDADVVSVKGDVSEAETAKAVFDEAMTRFGRVDTLVNNAGIFIGKPFTAYTADEYATYVSTNVTGFFHMSQRAADIMVKQATGHIVTITASLAEQPMTSVPAALASLTKGALNAATKALAIEFAGRGVRVNAVSPGVIKTTMHQPGTYEKLGSLHPLGRMGELSDIVDGILFLDTAPFITGEILHIDGGQAAGHHVIGAPAVAAARSADPDHR